MLYEILFGNYWTRMVFPLDGKVFLSLNGPVFCSHSKNQDGHHLKSGSDIKIDDTPHIKIIWDEVYFSHEGLVDRPREALSDLGWLRQNRGYRLGLNTGEEVRL